MKKILSLLLVLALLLALTACGAPAQVPEETAAPTEAATEAPAEEITEAPTEEPTEAEPVIRSPMKLELPQAEITDPAEKTEVPADASWAALSSDILAPDAMKSSSEPSDPYRPWYDLGVSTQMEGDVFTLLIFMDDYESSWTYEEIESFCTNKYYPAETWLCQQARNWGASVNFSSGYYGSDATVRVPYYGIIGDFSGNLNNDIMDQAATSIGFADKEALHQRMVEYSGTDNICYVVVVDKPGRSYAMMDWHNDGYEFMEYAMLFAQPLYVGQEKHKKAHDGQPFVIELVENPDIAAAVGSAKKPGQTLVGFAAETENLHANAQKKLAKKNLDLIVANDVSKPGAGFNVDTNIATLITADGMTECPLRTKKELAGDILDKVMEIRSK